MIDQTQELEMTAPRLFATTRWSVVHAAGEGASETSREAMEKLCNAYWHPIYVYVRRKGYGPDDAQDLTQEFFAQVITKQHFRLADHKKGKFRSFLLSTLHFFLAREWSRAHRQKRGGNYTFISLDRQIPEDGYHFEPTDGATPEKEFQRQWALAVLRQTMNSLEEECAAEGKAKFFQEVKHLLSWQRDGQSYTAIGASLVMSEAAVRVAVHRLRQRYGDLLRAEIAQTVDSDSEVDEELRFLARALSN
jgi:RNA polymerase sigma-70 factor (ECF subfamily)